MTGFVAHLLHGVRLAGRNHELGSWVQAFAAGRLAGLALTFCVAPFLIISPSLARDAVWVLAASLAANLLGFLMLRLASRPAEVLFATAFGMVPLTIGVVWGISPAAILIAAIALALDALAAPSDKRVAQGAAVLFGLAGAGMLLVAPAYAGAAQVLVAALLLPVASLITLHIQMAALRLASNAANLRAGEALNREQAMLAAANAAVLIAERSGHVVDATEQAGHLLGANDRALHGRGLVDRVLIADRPALLKAISDAAIDAAMAEITVRLAVNATGAAPDYAPFVLNIGPVSAAQGKAALRLSPAVSHASGRSTHGDRSALFAALSHEVRTPMNAIFGFSELLASPSLAPHDPAKVSEYANLIQSSARESFAVTRALVDLLRVETTPFSAEAEVDVEEMLRACLREAEGQQPSGAIQVRLHGTMSPIAADPRALRMLFSALVEGMTTACGGRAEIECTLGDSGLRPSLTMLVLAKDKHSEHERPAFLGVLRELSQRLADALGAELSIEQTTAGWRIALRFGLPVSPIVTPIAFAKTASFLPVESLRKSA